MPTLRLAHQVKLKDQPLETRLALRLVTMAEQNKKVAELRTLAKELGSVFMDTLKAVELLAVRKVITFKAITANQFEFQVEAANREALTRDAAAFKRHLEARAARAAKPRSGRLPPAHLPPFKDEERAPLIDKSTEIATKIGAPKLAKKVANCVLRIGQDEVEKLVQHVIATERPPEVSAVRAFFTLYRVRRDLLIPGIITVPPGTHVTA